MVVILAQTGSFVPAERARLGLVDRIFARVGAHDDLTRGRSTFMVEMLETSRLLHGATDSLARPAGRDRARDLDLGRSGDRTGGG